MLIFREILCTYSMDYPLALTLHRGRSSRKPLRDKNEIGLLYT